MKNTTIKAFIVETKAGKYNNDGYFADEGNFKTIHPEIDLNTHYYLSEAKAKQAIKMRFQCAYYPNYPNRDEEFGDKYLKEHFEIIPVELSVTEIKQKSK